MLVDKDGKPVPPWMAVGETWADDTGRQFVVREIDLKSPLERNVVGEVDGQPYACALYVFQAIWKKRVSP